MDRVINEKLIALLCDGDLPHWFLRCRDLFTVEELQAIAAGSVENAG